MSADAPSGRLLRLGLLISGGGTTLENLSARVRDRRLRGVEIRLVISSRSTVRGVGVARDAGLPLEIIRRRDYPDVAAFSADLAAALDRAGIDLVLMAGFLCLWRLPSHYVGRVLNIHPALLPRFGGRGLYGRRVHETVLAAGVRESGCTVHLVDHEYDHGPIVAQVSVPVYPDDTPGTLAERVGQAERDLYPRVVQQVADHGLAWLRQFG